MAQITTNNLEVTAVQQAMDEGSAITSSGMIGVAIMVVIVLAFLLAFLIVVYNMTAVRDQKISHQDIALMFKRIMYAVVFLSISLLLIGVFYAV